MVGWTAGLAADSATSPRQTPQSLQQDFPQWTLGEILDTVAVMSACSQILVVETTTAHATVGVLDRTGAWVQSGWHSPRSHNLMIFKHLETLLREKNLGAQTFDLVLVGSGPGSYSGTRVGISAALGIGIASNCQTVAVSSLAAVDSAGSCHEILVIGDARRGAYWHAKVADGNPMGPPELIRGEDLVGLMERAASRGIPMVSWEDPSRFPISASLKDLIRHEIPGAQGILRTWQRASGEQKRAWSALPPEPIYLMEPLITPSRKQWNIINRG